ncbi:putative protocadherin Fat 1 [Apostichopus japonicus]|uniref:Putative protocadherin Fat 1 n=1 Tax=Stichopus japonicus TaxID=307972 RepID=A0A2G8K1F6_STIJA|nr:putative protocadherin Fat 1 [Apostichopus japonicus]
MTAIDSDTDDNDRLEYSLTSGGNGKFVIDKESGSVSTDGTFDFERDSQTSYQLEVQVSDGENPVQDTLNIEITDVNDNRPIFNDKAPSGSIPENDPTPYYINASATDVDSVNLIYTVSASAPINTEISKEGILNITGPFDREIEDSLTFSVTVSDGVFETKVEVNVTIEDENDNTPGFTSLCDGLVTVAENSPTGTSVCQISAIDEDKPDTVYSTIEYSLLDSVEDRFQINKITGEITVMNEKLDFEGVKTFSLTVVATDGGGNSNSSTIQVDLEDVNDNPRCLTIILKILMSYLIWKLAVCKTFPFRLSFILRLLARLLPELIDFGPIVLPSVGIVTFQIRSILRPALRKPFKFQDPETFHENSVTIHQILLATHEILALPESILKMHERLALTMEISPPPKTR